jgi:hypothetical protein
MSRAGLAKAGTDTAPTARRRRRQNRKERVMDGLSGVKSGQRIASYPQGVKAELVNHASRG